MTAPVIVRQLIRWKFSSSELFRAAPGVLWDTAGTQWEALGREMARRSLYPYCREPAVTRKCGIAKNFHFPSLSLIPIPYCL